MSRIHMMVIKPFRMWLLSVVGLSLLLFGWSLPLVSANNIAPQTFYFVSVDNRTKDTSITIANLATMKAQHLLTIDYKNFVTPNQSFSAHELEVFNSDIKKGFYTRSTTNTVGVFREIEGTWLLDENRLLVETTNEVCQSPMLGCYGFYEFLIADITTGQLTSIQKIEYHSQLADRWTECGEHPQVYIGNVSPNPTQELFSFTLIPLPLNWCSGVSNELSLKSYAVIVNYADMPVNTRYIPFASGISWSPDGGYLSFDTVENCSLICELSVQLLSMTPNAFATLLYHEPLPRDLALFTAWIDNKTLVYPWLVSPSADTEAPIIIGWYWYDIIDKDQTQETKAFSNQFRQYSVFRLSQQCSILRLAQQEDVNFLCIPFPYSKEESLGFSAKRNVSVTTNFSPIDSIYYNSKFNTYVFVNLSIADNTVEVIDANLKQSSYNLSSFLTNPANEWIYFVAPGA